MHNQPQKITTQQLLTLIQQFQGRQIEVDLIPTNLTNQTNHTQTANTYNFFHTNEINDSIIFTDKDHNHPQQLIFYKSDISNISYTNGENIFKSTFTINLNNNQQIDLCVFEEPEHCYICNKLINIDYTENTWEINSTGGYGSHFDSEQVCLKICDDCMYEIVYGQKVLH